MFFVSLLCSLGCERGVWRGGWVWVLWDCGLWWVGVVYLWLKCSMVRMVDVVVEFSRMFEDVIVVMNMFIYCKVDMFFFVLLMVCLIGMFIFRFFFIVLRLYFVLNFLFWFLCFVFLCYKNFSKKFLFFFYVSDRVLYFWNFCFVNFLYLGFCRLVMKLICNIIVFFYVNVC